MRKTRITFLLFILGLIHCLPMSAQPVLENDYSYSLKIPAVAAMESTPAHLYVLSQNEGMAVFRTRQDSLQWLYTASGMQQRGDKIRTDIRFAYLFGNSKRLTVLEPTSVMGAYSATTLPEKPLDVLRFDENLYVALGPDGLGKLNLHTPETLDSPVHKVETGPTKNPAILSLADSDDQVYALSADGKILAFNKNEHNISYQKEIELNQSLAKIFYVNQKILGSDEKGNIFEISTNGNFSKLGSIGEPVEDIKSWNDWLIIKGNSSRLWTSYQLTEPTLWKKNRDAGNYITVSKGQLWLCEYGRLNKIQEVSAENASQSQQTNANYSGDLELQPIGNQTIPYPYALLLPLELKNNFPVQNVQFNVQSDVDDIQVRGQSLYWKPKSSDKGDHRFKVIASTPGGKTATTSFRVDVQPFNSPPRFTPMRTISIPVGRPFNLPISAIDPDGTPKDLIRYLGVNLPNGADIDDQTGEFRWTPTKRQLGENSFRIIATDQYGAASSANLTIRVIETNTGDN